MFESTEFPGQMETDVLAFVDPRTSFLGVRVICGDGSFELDQNLVKVYDDQKEYNLVRHICGIPEGGKEIGNQFPLNMNAE